MKTHTAPSALTTATAAFSNSDPAAAAKSLFEQFRLLRDFDADSTIAIYQALQQAWEHSISDSLHESGRSDLTSQLQQAREAVVTQMVNLCHSENGSARRRLYARFMAVLYTNRQNTYNSIGTPTEIKTLKSVPLWFYLNPNK